MTSVWVFDIVAVVATFTHIGFAVAAGLGGAVAVAAVAPILVAVVARFAGIKTPVTATLE